jgi:hypothetical protein
LFLILFLWFWDESKTIESLMYGKIIIGTKEAFEGFDIDIKKAVGLTWQ